MKNVKLYGTTQELVSDQGSDKYMFKTVPGIGYVVESDKSVYNRKKGKIVAVTWDFTYYDFEEDYFIAINQEDAQYFTGVWFNGKFYDVNPTGDTMCEMPSGPGEYTVEYEIPAGEDTLYGHFYSALDISIPNGIKRIKEGCFGTGTGSGVLRNVTLPNTLEYIEFGVFALGFIYNDTGVTIPSVIEIGDAAFNYCHGWHPPVSGGGPEVHQGLKSIELPANLVRIGEECFRDSELLSSITCHATTAPSFGQWAFLNISETGTLYYPAGSDYSSWLSELGNGWTGVEI